MHSGRRQPDLDVARLRLSATLRQVDRVVGRLARGTCEEVADRLDQLLSAGPIALEVEADARLVDLEPDRSNGRDGETAILEEGRKLGGLRRAMLVGRVFDEDLDLAGPRFARRIWGRGWRGEGRALMRLISRRRAAPDLVSGDQRHGGEQQRDGHDARQPLHPALATAAPAVPLNRAQSGRVLNWLMLAQGCLLCHPGRTASLRIGSVDPRWRGRHTAKFRDFGGKSEMP